MARTHAGRASGKLEEAYRLIEKALRVLGFRKTNTYITGKGGYYRNKRCAIEMYYDNDKLVITVVDMKTYKVSTIEIKTR